MERIIIKHLSGSKANQQDTFALAQFKELSFGRDPACTIAFDPERDDVVSRSHARIAQDAQEKKQFTIFDLGSRNGVFVNKTKISGSSGIKHGDVIQLGADGPEFRFELDPPPMKATRVFDAAPHAGDGFRGGPRPTTGSMPGAQPSDSVAPSGHRTVGRNTVERMITHGQSQSRKYLINTAAGILGVIALVSGVVIYKDGATKEQIATVDRQLTDVAAIKTDVKEIKSVMAPKQIAEAYGPATVYLEVAWHLVDTVSGSPLYHEHLNGRPVYLQWPNGTIEPKLTTRGKGNKAIGGQHTGTGFVVTENGFALTNRHVAATWETKYNRLEFPGLLVGLQNDKLALLNENFSPTGGLAWVPAKSLFLKGQAGEPGRAEGRHLRLNVTFPQNTLRIPAKLVRTSNIHDVAMIKIDTPAAVKPVLLAADGNYEAVRPGDPITVLGYPGVSPSQLAVSQSRDPFNLNPDVVTVPDTTVTPGLIGKVIRATANQTGGEKVEYYSGMDSYQLSANATGPGNSGGPVFDERGRVIAVFFAGNDRMTFAVPIKFGQELMRVGSVLKEAVAQGKS